MYCYAPMLSNTHLWPQEVFIGLKNIKVDAFQICVLGRKAVTPGGLKCLSG